MPARQDLPESLAGLARRNALFIRHESFGSDAGRLITAIERVLAAAPGTAVVSSAPRRSAGQPAGNALARWLKGLWPARNDLARAARLFTDAERIANSITNESSKAWALSGVAKALAATDPDRAARLLADAERIANSITDESSKASALSDIAEALAATDPDRAERIANSITDESAKASALRGIAEALAATDPDRAERIANSITSEYCEGIGAERHREGAGRHRPRPRRTHRQLHHRRAAKASALSDIAKALAATDPDRAARLLADAERIANSITDESSKASALSGIAEALAATDPDRAARLLADAERIANSITDEYSKASALSDIAQALAATDPDRAERIANSITDESVEGIGTERHRGGAGRHRPRPRRTHRQLHHRRVREGIGAERHREGAGRHVLVGVLVAIRR